MYLYNSTVDLTGLQSNESEIQRSARTQPRASAASARRDAAGRRADGADPQTRASRRCGGALATRAEENAREQRELYLRAVAELDNVRKRAQRDIEQRAPLRASRASPELLPVRDSLELGVRSGAQRRCAARCSPGRRRR